MMGTTVHIYNTQIIYKAENQTKPKHTCIHTRMHTQNHTHTHTHTHTHMYAHTHTQIQLAHLSLTEGLQGTANIAEGRQTDRQVDRVTMGERQDSS